MKASLGVFNGTLKAPVSLVIMIKAKSLEEERKMKEVDADQGLVSCSKPRHWYKTLRAKAMERYLETALKICVWMVCS